MDIEGLLRVHNQDPFEVIGCINHMCNSGTITQSEAYALIDELASYFEEV